MRLLSRIQQPDRMLEKIGVPDMVGMLVREAKISDVAEAEAQLF